MRKTFRLIILFLCAQTVNAQISSSCIVPQTVQNNYDRDVNHLALNRIINQNSSYKDSIVIPQNYKDTIWQGLSAIFNLTSIVARDSVFDNYCIHQAVNIVYHKIYVAVDTSYSWTHQWQNLISTTGITQLDNLLSMYGFTITHFSTFGSNYATLETTQNINVTPLCDSIATFNGVLYSEPVTNVGDGNEIVYNKYGNDRFYDFSVGYGDCPSGCTSRLIFKFKVYDNCSVDYLGRFNYGMDILPAPTNCNITTSINEKELTNFNIYPNPAEDFINIETNYLLNTNYNIINLYGQILQTGMFTNRTTVSIKNLTTGMYLIKFYNQRNNEFANYKLLKK